MKIQALALFALLAAGCGYSNSTSNQEAPPTSFLHTMPRGATVLIVEQNLMLRTPCELNYSVAPWDEIEVRKDGYRTWRGKLEDLPRTADRTYRLELERL